MRWPWTGSYAYVADESAGLRVIDVSNPGSPAEVGFVGHRPIGLRGRRRRRPRLRGRLRQRRAGHRHLGADRAAGGRLLRHPGVAYDIAVAATGRTWRTGQACWCSTSARRRARAASARTTPPATAVSLTLSNGTVVLADNDAGLAVFDDCRDVVFADGFEALGASAWSAVQP